MKRIVATLDDGTYEDLRRLAFERTAPMAGLVRLALDRTFEDDLDRIAGERGLDDHLKDPSATLTIEKYAEARGLALPGRHL